MEKYFSEENSAKNKKEKDIEFGKNVEEKLIEELVNIMESDALMNKMADYGTSNETREWGSQA